MPAYPPAAVAGSAIKSAFARRTTGGPILNNTSWGDIPDIVGTMDLSVEAAVGDRIQASISGGSFSGEAVQVCLDVASRVAGANVNWWGASGGASDLGGGCWFIEAFVGKVVVVGGTIIRTLVSGDISGGLVTCRMQYRTLVASTRQLTASAETPLHFSIVNLGPG